MNISTIRRCMLLSLIGVLLLAIDMYIPTSIIYPHSYQNDSSIIGEYQYYNIKAFFGATCTYKELDASGNVIKDSIPQGYQTDAQFVDQVFFDNFRIDLFNDLVGLILIILACISLVRYSKAFSLSMFFAAMSMVISFALSILPFIFNGIALCNMALGVGISLLIAKIITTFFLFKGFIFMIPDASCREERLWINTGWFVSFVLMILTLFLRWLDLMPMMYIFTAVLAADVFFLGYFLKRVDIFVLKFCQSIDQATESSIHS